MYQLFTSWSEMEVCYVARHAVSPFDSPSPTSDHFVVLFAVAVPYTIKAKQGLVVFP